MCMICVNEKIFDYNTLECYKCPLLTNVPSFTTSDTKESKLKKLYSGLL